MSVMTVTGPIRNDQAGFTAPHEHIFLDITNQAPDQNTASGKKLADARVEITNLGKLKRNPFSVLDNLRLDEEDTAIEELVHFKKAGGSTLVDVTPQGVGRDPAALKKASMESGVQVVMGCGFLTQDTHPAFVEESSVHDLTDILLEEIQSGVGGTGICAGVIGEIGTSASILEHERKVAAAAGAVQSKTGLGMHLHTYAWGREGLEGLELLKKQGADMHKVAVNHIDVDIDLDYCLSLVNAGAFIEFDNFGKEYYIDSFDRREYLGGVFMTDAERVRSIRYLVEKGCAEHILITCDVCFKTLLHRYGGWGYDHILNHIIPMMRDFNIQEKDIETIAYKNPIEFMCS